MQKIELVTLTHDCCAVCEYIMKSSEYVVQYHCLYGEKTEKTIPFWLEIKNPYNTICKGNNFKRIGEKK